MSYRVDQQAATEAFAQHRSEWSDCTRCDLCKHRLTVVHGSGPVPCNVMIVGERPGVPEDSQGLPFVGRSGDYLDNILLRAARTPRTDLFLTNVLGCHPQSGVGLTEEMREACKERLFREIQIVSPIVILTMGRYAASTLFGKPKLALQDVAGILTPVTIQGQYVPYQVSMIATHHPAHLFRLQQEEEEGYRDVAKETLRHLCMAIDIANEYDRLKEGRKA